MKIKVCGLKYAENIQAVSRLDIDFMGFIFYERSPRFVSNLPALSRHIPQKKVGVFVNQNVDLMLRLQRKHKFDYIQLHGNEDITVIQKLAAYAKIIKAFSLDNSFDFNLLTSYESSVAYFLFDTKSANYGGSGKKFNWMILENYHFKKPYFLSGGIGEKDAMAIKNLPFKYLYGVDINSKFEDKVGLKNIPKIKRFIANL